MITAVKVAVQARLEGFFKYSITSSGLALAAARSEMMLELHNAGARQDGAPTP